ncbi:MAG: response regulator [Alphaproteobacteria bacterium]|nr:response regulator [Alphaproteobacteria bacterium]MBF0128376.1 response regulator [Alphaproteobacteria bacterium]
MGAATLEKLAFLVVEDNFHMRQLVVMVLKSFRATNILTAADGSSAFREMGGMVPDIIITDMMMKPMNGIEFTRKLRTDDNSPDPFVPILMLSSYSELERVVAAREAGVTEFLNKPFAARTLYARIHSMIYQPRQFVRSETYFGPDRRRHDKPFMGDDRRRRGPPGAELIPLSPRGPAANQGGVPPNRQETA